MTSEDRKIRLGELIAEYKSFKEGKAINFSGNSEQKDGGLMSFGPKSGESNNLKKP